MSQCDGAFKRIHTFIDFCSHSHCKSIFSVCGVNLSALCDTFICVCVLIGFRLFSKWIYFDVILMSVQIEIILLLFDFL